MDNAFSDLSDLNCGFCVGHSFNVRRLLDHEKTRKNYEGKKKATTARFIAYCSCKNDNKNLGWKTDSGIKPGCVYAVCKVIGFTKPGREGYTVDWDFGHIIEVKPPIPLPKGVGRGTVFFPRNNPHLQQPFAKLTEFLRLHSGSARTHGFCTYACVLFHACTHIHAHTHTHTHTHTPATSESDCGPVVTQA